MNFLSVPPGADEQQIAVTEALNSVLTELEKRWRSFEEPWQGFAVIFGARGEGGAKIKEALTFLYLPERMVRIIDINMNDELQTAVESLLDSSAGKAGFQQAVSVISLERASGKLGNDTYWDQNADEFMPGVQSAEVLAQRVSPVPLG